MSVLRHPMVGRDSLVSGAVIVGLVLLCLAGLSHPVLETVVFVDGPLGEWDAQFERYAAALQVGLASTWGFAMLYGWVNGGPGLAGTMALVPPLIGEWIQSTGLDFSPSFVVAMAGASVAVWLASWVSYAPEERPDVVGWAFGLGVLVTTLAAGSLWYGSVELATDSMRAATLSIGLFATGVLFGGIWTLAIGVSRR